MGKWTLEKLAALLQFITPVLIGAAYVVLALAIVALVLAILGFSRYVTNAVWHGLERIVSGMTFGAYEPELTAPSPDSEESDIV